MTAKRCSVLLCSIAAAVTLGAPTSSGVGVSAPRNVPPAAAAVERASSVLPATVSGEYVIAGDIQAMVRVGGAVYVGGDFGRVADRTGAGIVMAARGARMEPVRAEIAGGPVNAAVADGSDGWYVGGSFTSVGKVHRSGLAHVRADGTLDPVFAPASLGEVRALALAGNVLVVIAAPPDGSAAVARALDRTTGAALPITYARPQGAGGARVLLTDASRLYIGFGKRRLAAYDVAGGTRFWAQQFCGTCFAGRGGVVALALDREKLIVGGGLKDGRSKNLEVLDVKTGARTGRPLQVPRTVKSIAVAQRRVYVAYSRERPGTSGLAVVDLETGRLRSWGRIRPSILSTDGTTVYMDGLRGVGERKESGFFGVYAARAGTARAVLRRVSPALAHGGPVLALAPQGGRLFVGGGFTGAGGSARHNLAAFDARTGKLLRWAPDARPVSVSALAAEGQTIYLGGSFDSIAGAPRTGLAAVSARGKGRLLPWHPRLASARVNALAVGAGRVFAGGNFGLPASNQPRKVARLEKIVAFSSRGLGHRIRFAPKLGFEFDIGALSVWRRTLLVGGQHLIAYSADGDGRHGLWAHSTDAYVFALMRRGATLYVGGNFQRMDRRPRQNLAAIALDRHGALLPFAPKVPIGVHALAPFGSNIVFGGQGQDTYGKVHQALGAVAEDGTLERWRVDVAADSINVGHIVPIPRGLLVAGIFNWLGPEGHQAAGGIAWLR